MKRTSPLVVLGYAFLAVPVVLDFLYVHSFGVNVPFEDSWNGSLPIAKAMSSGHIYLAQLYAPHTDNRMFFPNLILGLLDSHTRANAKIDMYVSALIMTGSLAALVWLVRRATGLHPLLLLPVGFLVFDWVQVENLLWAFQLAWILVILCLVVELLAFDHGPRYGPFTLAVLAAGVASYSSLQGLLLWPVGLVFAALCGWRRRWLALWTLLAAVATTVYLWNFGSLGASSGLKYDLAHPYQTLLYLLQLIGAVSGTQALIAAGVATVIALLLGLGVWLARRAPLSGLRVPLALILMALLFDLLVTEGRTFLAVPGSSRYTTYNLLLVVGMYLIAMQLLVRSLRSQGEPSRGPTAGAVDRVVGALLITGCLAVVGGGMAAGFVAGQQYEASREAGVTLLREYRTVPPAELSLALYNPSGQYVKHWARWLQARHWSVFSDG